MDRPPTALLVLAAVLAAALVTTASAAAAPSPPTLLPAAARTLDAGATTARTCAEAPRRGRGLDGATYRAPMSGFLTVRLAGRGDWDLLLRDAASGRALGAGQGFGGRETAQTWVAAGQRVVAQGCRREGAGRRARVRFVLADVEPPTTQGPPRLVRVRAGEDELHALERLGFDVTHNRRDGRADVVVAGDGQLARLRTLGIPFETRIADLTEAFREARAADRAYADRLGAAGTPLPSGRDPAYRTFEEIQAEMKALVDEHPGLVRKVVFGTSHQGREIAGVEIAEDVEGDDGRPVFFLMGVHHAREWPSAEAAMEFAHLLVGQRGDARIARLLDRGRVVILPVVNVDGFVSSRSAFDPGDQLAGGDPNVTLVEAVAPPGGLFAYRRKNCNGEVLPPETPCELTWGVDDNRNYGNLWGGPGSSSDVTSQSYHGPGPRSERETQAVWDFVRTHHVTTLVSVHTVAALVLRPPGLHDAGLAPDEERMKAIGDAMGRATGYTSQYAWQLYDTAGTTEDDTYAATGGYGFTIEMGPPDGNFHEPYETGVVEEWTGENEHAQGRGGMREALLIAAEAAVDPTGHAVIRGTAPAGRVLRLRKTFETRTSPYCEKGVEPLVAVEALPVGRVCLTGEQPPQTLRDEQDATTTVPASGAFAWHVGQSTRPFVGGGAVKETDTDVGPPLATFTGAPAAPTTTVDHEFVLPADHGADKLEVTLTPTLPEDYDIVVSRRDGDRLVEVGTSGNLPGSSEEVLVADPVPGTYVVSVDYYAAATGQYEVVARRVKTERTVTRGTKEAYTFTCESPDGTVLDERTLVIDRGEAVDLRLGCGEAPSTFADGTPLPPAIVAAQAPSASRGAAERSSSRRPARRRARIALRGGRRLRVGRGGAVRLRLACPRTVRATCRGTVRLRGRPAGRRVVTLGRGAFAIPAGRTRTVRVRLGRRARRAVRAGRRLRATVRAAGRAGVTRLTGGRRVVLRH